MASPLITPTMTQQLINPPICGVVEHAHRAAEFVAHQ
jgi:hypothetical protein